MITYKYKEYVSNIKINGSNKFRFLLEVTLKQNCNNKSALVIMQNPSKANKRTSDQTINTVLYILHKFGYSKVYIVNLIPLYGTNSKLISNTAARENKIYEQNDKIISEKISEVTKIFVAWGGKNSFSKDLYDKRIKVIQNLLMGKNAYCYNINLDGTSVHPSRNQWKKEATEDEFLVYSFN